jgi:hypothetical protein
MAGGVVLPSLLEATASLLAPRVELPPALRRALLNAALACAEGREHLNQFCIDAVAICGERSGTAAERLHERLARELMPLEGIPALLSDPALTCELRLISDYPAEWLLPALTRGRLARIFPAGEIAYVAALGGFPGLLDALVERRVIVPDQTLWVDAHSPRTSAALRKGIDAIIFEDARRLRRDLGMWRLLPLSA